MIIEGIKTPEKLSEKDFALLPKKILLEHTKENDKILFPYMPEANFAYIVATNERKSLVYDKNPLIKLSFECQFSYPSIAGIRNRLSQIKINLYDAPENLKKHIHFKTYNEIISIKKYLAKHPRNFINLWIRYLISEIINSHIKRSAQCNQEDLPYINVPLLIINTYKNIYDSVDPLKFLILFDYIPDFVDEDKLSDALKGTKASLVYYSPYSLNIKEYYQKNLLKFWFLDLKADALQNIQTMQKDEWAIQSKKNFAFLNKLLDDEGIIYVETHHLQSDLEFIKMALFYGYTSLKSFTNDKGSVVLILKKP